MIVLRFFLLAAFLAVAKSECEHDWTPVRNINFFKNNAVTAGNFKKNMPAYIGVANTGRKGLVPGRIQIENPAGFYYTHNMQVEVEANNYEFLKKNDEYNYTWVDASSLICVDNAVIVDEYYIGRTVGGEFNYVGRVDIGQGGLKYETSDGQEVTTNHYQVLVCLENSCSNDVKDQLKECKDGYGKCKKSEFDAKNEVQKCENEKKECKSMFAIVQENNNLLRGQNENVLRQLNNCGKPQLPAVTCPTTPAPSACNTSNNTKLAADVAKLQGENQELSRQLQAANLQCNQKITEANAEVKNLQNSLKTSETQNLALQNQVNRLIADNRNLTRICNKPSKTGVAGCLSMLEPVTTISADEQTTLLLRIAELMDEKDKAKIGMT